MDSWAIYALVVVDFDFCWRSLPERSGCRLCVFLRRRHTHVYVVTGVYMLRRTIAFIISRYTIYTSRAQRLCNCLCNQNPGKGINCLLYGEIYCCQICSAFVCASHIPTYIYIYSHTKSVVEYVVQTTITLYTPLLHTHQLIALECGRCRIFKCAKLYIIFNHRNSPLSGAR